MDCFFRQHAQELPFVPVFMVTYIFRSVQLTLFSSVVSYDDKFDLINDEIILSYMGKCAMGITTAVLRISQPLLCSSMCKIPHAGDLHTAEP